MACLAMLVFALFLALMPGTCSVAHAVEPIVVKPEQEKVDITALGELYEGRGDKPADRNCAWPGRICRADGGAGYDTRHQSRLARLRALQPDQRSDHQMAGRADRYTLANSRVLSPELDAARIAAITPSFGFRPERMKSDRADMFRLISILGRPSPSLPR